MTRQTGIFQEVLSGPLLLIVVLKVVCLSQNDVLQAKEAAIFGTALLSPYALPL